jgi:hypothetical protein
MTVELVVMIASLDFTISAWLEAKTQRSNSARTATENANTLRSFRNACQAAGTDLDGDVYALKLILQTWAGHSRTGRLSRQAAIISVWLSSHRSMPTV